MRSSGKWLGRLLLAVALAAAALWAFGPREPVTGPSFDPAALGADLDAYLAASEAEFDDIRPGAAKRIVWAGEPGGQTEFAVVYIHGFSASAEEIRPVPDRVAEALGANLFFTRLTGHGRDGAAMAQARVGAWRSDVAEALAIGQRLGTRVLVLSTSTGGTLAAIAAASDAAPDVAGYVFVSPNFAVNAPTAGLLTWPAARWWLPLVIGAERSWEPRNAAHGAHWTTAYPTVAILPMAAAVAHADALDLGAATAPALFVFSDADQVVSPAATRAAASEWGGPVTLHPVTVGPDDDPQSHVIAGDIMSPGMTTPIVARILDWVAEAEL